LVKEKLNKEVQASLRRAVSALSVQETREGQIFMCQFLRRFYNFTEGQPGYTVIVEAGTGTGKTFAYLTALCEYIRHLKNMGYEKDDFKTVIATNTLSLQEQLINKDIPVIKEIYPEISFEKAKGKNNYICHEKVAELSKGDLFSDNDEDELQKVFQYINNPEASGERQELDVSNALWKKICADTHECYSRSCPYHKECFYEKARRKLKNADVIVTTHATVLTDFLQTQILPKYRYLIVDEAHNLEKNTLNALTIEISRERFARLVQKSETRYCQGGFQAGKVLTKIQEWTKSLIPAAETFFATLHEGRAESPQEENEQGKLLLQHLQAAAPLIKKAIQAADIQIFKVELVNFFEEVLTLEKELATWLYHDKPEHVYWVENRKAKYAPYTTDCLAPLWESKVSVLTSATLSVARKFDAIKNSLCLCHDNVYTLKIDSPFNYKENALVYLPPKAPSPKNGQYAQYLINTIKSILLGIGGKVFILFTSYSMMNEVYQGVTESLGNCFTLLLQGESSREKLLETYRKTPDAVLFGTDTFWEGIDEEINCIIITRLPFAVPTEPIQQAKYEKIKESGGNPFMLKSIPECALKLKQGIGRLIRRQDKKGVIVICDPRIKQSWSKNIIRTLPEMRWTGNPEMIEAYIRGVRIAKIS